MRANCVAKIFYLINSLLPQCAQTVALEMLQQYADNNSNAGALTVPDLQHYPR